MLIITHTNTKTSPQAYCPNHSGRSEPSFGRRRRDVANSTIIVTSNDTAEARSDDSPEASTKKMDKDAVYKVSIEEAEVDKYLKDEVETPSHVRKMIEVRGYRLMFHGCLISGPMIFVLIVQMETLFVYECYVIVMIGYW